MTKFVSIYGRRNYRRRGQHTRIQYSRMGAYDLYPLASALPEEKRWVPMYWIPQDSLLS